MNTNGRSYVCVVYGYSQEFTLNVGVQHGSVLSHLLFIIGLEALSHVLRFGAPWEDIYADHLVIITESLEEHVRKLVEGVEDKIT